MCSLGAAAGCASDGGADQVAVTTARVTSQNPYVGLLWSNEDGASGSHFIADLVALADDQTSVDVDLDAPPADAISAAPLSDGSSVRLALAAVVLFDDVDGDGTFRVRDDNEGLAGEDLLVGLSADALLYLEDYPAGARSIFVNPDDAHPGFMPVAAECEGLDCKLRVLPSTPIVVDPIDPPTAEFPNCTLGSCSSTSGV